MSPALAISADKLLIVEGRDEERLFTKALITWDIAAQVMPIGGKTGLSAMLRTLLADPAFARVSAVAVMRDADDDAIAAFQSVSDALGGVGLSPPAGHGQFGAGPPRVGVYVLPGGATPGMLETVCLRSVEAELLNCVSAYFNCVERAGAKLSAEVDKARVHAWLATRARPDLRLGEAAEAGFLDFSRDAFADLRTFCREL